MATVLTAQLATGSLYLNLTVSKPLARVLSLVNPTFENFLDVYDNNAFVLVIIWSSDRIIMNR